MSKRVLIFSLNYYPFVGGAEVAIKEITDRINPEDIEFHLIAYRFDSATPKTERIGNVIVHRIGIGKKDMTVRETFHPVAYLGKILYVPLAAVTAFRLVRTYRFDAFWSMMSYMVFPIALLRLVGVRRPYVISLQEGDPFERQFGRRRIRLVAPLLRYGFRHATTVQAISTFLLTWARAAGFIGEGEVIPNGVDTERFAKKYGVAEINSARRSLEKKKGHVFLVTTSRLVAKNAVDDVIRALTHLPEHISFLIYGIGPDEEALRALSQHLSVSNRVRFMGQVSHEELPLILSACDVFVRPSRSEGMGNSFIEAMATGLPVIATQEGGITDFLFDAKRNPGKASTGWAVDKDAPKQIAEAVERILNHPDEVRRVTKTARAMAKESYDWRMIAESMKRVFDGLLVPKERKTKESVAPVPSEQSQNIQASDQGRRLIIATPLYPPDPGGPATYARLLENGMPFPTIVVKFSNVLKHPKFVRHAMYAWNVFHEARKQDVVLALDPVSVGLPALIAARLRRAAFAVKIVGDYAWEQGVQRFGVGDTLDQFVMRTQVPVHVSILRSIQTRVAKSARIVIVPSEYLKGIVSAWHITPERIRVIYNAIELEETTDRFEKEVLARPLIVTAGRLVPWKRVGGIIDAVASLPVHSPASLLIVGDGPNRALLETQGRRQLGERVACTGALPHAETLAAMRAGDIFVLNSTYEGLSHVLIEALMLGKPIIATDVGGNSELITNEQNGLLIPANDTKALTDALTRLLNDAVLRERLAANALASSERFSLDRMRAQTAELIERL